MNKLTVFGGGGFIGSNIISQAKKFGYEAHRGNWDNIQKGEIFGDIIYCLGEGNCNKPYEVLSSHLTILQEILKNTKFKRITYVSSTRVYLANDKSHEDTDVDLVCSDERKLFNLVKLTAEALLEKSGVDFRIVRPSNVYGTAVNSPLFLPSIVRDAIIKKEVDMYVPPHYSKDYVHVDDVVCLTLAITKNSEFVRYNIASGRNTSAYEIANILESETNCKINWHGSNNCDSFPLTEINRVVDEYDYKPKVATELIADMIKNFRKELI